MTASTIDYSALKKNKEYYVSHKDELLKKYEGQYILLYECEVKKSSTNWAELAQHGVSTYGAGNFCVQLCIKQEPVADVSHIIRTIHGA